MAVGWSESARPQHFISVIRKCFSGFSTGSCIAVFAGVILGIKNREAILQLWRSLEASIGKSGGVKTAFPKVPAAISQFTEVVIPVAEGYPDVVIAVDRDDVHQPVEGVAGDFCQGGRHLLESSAGALVDVLLNCIGNDLHFLQL